MRKLLVFAAIVGAAMYGWRQLRRESWHVALDEEWRREQHEQRLMDGTRNMP